MLDDGEQDPRFRKLARVVVWQLKSDVLAGEIEVVKGDKV